MNSKAINIEDIITINLATTKDAGVNNISFKVYDIKDEFIFAEAFIDGIKKYLKVNKNYILTVNNRLVHENDN